jgi:hypothetical protein
MRPVWGANGRVNWWRLRPVGSLLILKVSYPILVVTPYLAKYKEIAEYLGLYNWIVLTAFFASVSLALANFVYDVFCPLLVKRFDSPNTLYKEMLQIKQLSSHLYPTDKFDASLEHCRKAYIDSAAAKPIYGTICAALFLTSGVLFFIILGDRVWTVVRSIF